MSLNEGLLLYLFPEGVPAWLYFGCLFFVLLISYMLGSVNTAIIVSRVLYKEDIRKKGSGNAGLTNMLRVYGKRAAVLTLVGDIMKAAVSIFISGLLFGFVYRAAISTNHILYFSAALVAIGHVFPCFYRFKGGKGVLVTSTAALILSPYIFLGLLLLFIAIVAISKYVSLGSVSVAILYPVALNFYFRFALRFVVDGVEYAGQVNFGVALASMILACLIVWCHRENLKRIGNRTENKLSFKKKSKDEEN